MAFIQNKIDRVINYRDQYRDICCVDWEIGLHH